MDNLELPKQSTWNDFLFKE